jgi:hypothetical protein
MLRVFLIIICLFSDGSDVFTAVFHTLVRILCLFFRYSGVLYEFFFSFLA